MAGGAGSTWGRDRHRLISLEEAWRRIAAEVTPAGVTAVALEEAAGRALAGPVMASDDCPAFDKAMMDGFAVRAADGVEAGTGLKVRGLIRAGASSSVGIGPGEAMRINTGAPVPAGADAVIMVEQTALSVDGAEVRILAAVRPGQHIAARGIVRRKGDGVLTPPIRLGAAQMAAAATAGARSVEVYDEVGAAIVVTGDELVPVGGTRGAGQIVDSNGPMLAALMRQFGAMPCPPSLARDDEADLRARFGAAMAHPLVLAVGGMSMGTRDLVPAVLADLGVRWVFHGVAVRPGKPAAYGRGPGGQHVFGLPGHPASAFICAWVFVRMVIEGMQGFAVRPPRRWRATLAQRLAASRDPRPAFVPARVWSDRQRGMMTEPCPWRGSADPFGPAAANALLVRSKPTEATAAGSAVEVIQISDWMTGDAAAGD